MWLVADHDVASLLGFRDRPHRRATNGGHGSGQKRHGRDGKDSVVEVPEGTVVKREDVVVADLARHGDRFLAASGGQGGKGNSRFLSNRRRAPSFAEQGEVGEETWFDLELKLMADVALVGFPNSGKSTLISRISAARPKIADYPFTTLEPHLGVVRSEETEFVVADVPGLIEGASDGKGLGHRFLRHVERARVIALLLDLAPAEDRSPAEQRDVLLRELERYRPELLSRPRVEVGTKADVATTRFDGRSVSAVTGEGIASLVGELARLVVELRETPPVEEALVVVHRPVPKGVSVLRRQDGSFVVHGRAAERAVAISDLSNPDAIAYVQDRLRKLGVDRALARAGARDGDTVRVGGFNFTYVPDLPATGRSR